MGVADGVESGHDSNTKQNVHRIVFTPYLTGAFFAPCGHFRFIFAYTVLHGRDEAGERI